MTGMARQFYENGTGTLPFRKSTAAYMDRKKDLSHGVDPHISFPTVPPATHHTPRPHLASSLPPRQRPKEWADIEDPVCILRVSLYGHPLASLFCEKFCQDKIFKKGFQKALGWECLYVEVCVANTLNLLFKSTK